MTDTSTSTEAIQSLTVKDFFSGCDGWEWGWEMSRKVMPCASGQLQSKASCNLVMLWTAWLSASLTRARNRETRMPGMVQRKVLAKSVID